MKVHIKKPTADAVILFFAALYTVVFILAECGYYTRGGMAQTAALMRAFLLCLIGALYCLGGRLLQLRKPETHGLRKALFLCFVLYLYLLVSVTLTDPSLGRGAGSVYDTPREARAYYMEHFVNLVPFESIYSVYIKGFFGGYVSAKFMLLNLLGNLCAFAPFAFFLPLFVKPLRRWYLFLPAVTLAILAVEGLQLLFMVGSCDIDDLILNLFGAMLAFPACRKWR